MAYAVTGVVADVAHMGNSVVLFENAEIRLKPGNANKPLASAAHSKRRTAEGGFLGVRKFRIRAALSGCKDSKQACLCCA